MRNRSPNRMPSKGRWRSCVPSPENIDACCNSSKNLNRVVLTFSVRLLSEVRIDKTARLAAAKLLDRVTLDDLPEAASFR